MKKETIPAFLYLLLLLIMSTTVYAQSFKPGSEPDGFDGLKWGVELSKIKGMEYIKDAEIGGSYPDDLQGPGGDLAIGKIQIYRRTGGKLTFSGMPLKSLRYGFSGGRLCEVTMTTKGPVNWGTLKKAVFNRYGKVSLQAVSGAASSQLTNEPEYYMWIGRISEMDLVYNPVTGIGEWWLGSVKIRNRIIEEARQKIKNAAPPSQEK